MTSGSGFRAAVLLANLYRGKDRKKKRNNHNNDRVMDAVAFQDHLVRDLDMKSIFNKKKQKSKTKKKATWTCDTCTLGHNLGENCRACGTKHVRKHNDVTDLEYRPTLSLAQKRGLVEPPPPKLTNSEWKIVEIKSKKIREEKCPICREHFTLTEQVILSCGHVFHRTCLRSFERFVRSSKRFCPICRKQNYQKKLCTEGAKMYRERCAILIQCFVRMCFAQRSYMNRIKKLYESGGGNELLRQKYLLGKLQNVTRNLGEVVEQQESAVDRLFNEVDRNISLSRKILGAQHRFLLSVEEDLNWERVRSEAISRHDTDCPICMEKVDLSAESSNDNSSITSSSISRCCSSVILSCSHVFHKNCIEAFEEFNIYELLLCPLCRNPYQKRPLWS